jgi:hypothetical protein
MLTIRVRTENSIPCERRIDCCDLRQKRITGNTWGMALLGKYASPNSQLPTTPFLGT